MNEVHFACKNLKLSIRQQPGTVWLKLEDPLAMQEIEVKCEVNESSILSRSYHVKESIVIGIRRLIHMAIDDGLIKISLAGALGVLSTSNKKAPLVKWEPQEEEANLL